MLVSSFHPDLLLHVRRHLPQLSTGLLLAGPRTLSPRLMTVLAKSVGAQAVHPELKLVSQQLVSRLKQQGLLVNVWTVNEPADFARLDAWGVDGIITDRPREAAGELGCLPMAPKQGVEKHPAIDSPSGRT